MVYGVNFKAPLRQTDAKDIAAVLALILPISQLCGSPICL